MPTPTQKAVSAARAKCMDRVSRSVLKDLGTYQTRLADLSKGAKLRKQWLLGAIAATKATIRQLKLGR